MKYGALSVILWIIPLLSPSHSFAPRPSRTRARAQVDMTAMPRRSKAAITSAILSSLLFLSTPTLSFSLEDGANDGSNAKIRRGGASTLQQGISKTITRGVNIDNADFHGQNLKGVAFQQSIVRDADFRGCNLVGAGFFDATLDGSDFEVTSSSRTTRAVLSPFI